MCDALYMKVRENHRIVSKGVYIGIGIDSDGRRTILGFDVQDGESEDNSGYRFSIVRSTRFVRCKTGHF